MSLTPPKVKICGITNLEDAELAVELGAWALGMIFFEGSPRRCSPAEAERIVASLRRECSCAACSSTRRWSRSSSASEDLGLTMLQFHGEEGPAYCAEAARRNGARVIKAAQVSGPGDVRDLERFHVDYHLLDARAKDPAQRGLRGGTGETFDWGLREPAPLEGAADPQRWAERRQRGRRDRAHEPLRGRHAPAAPRLRPGARTPTSCARSSPPVRACDADAPRAAATSRRAAERRAPRAAATTRARRAPLRHLRRAVRAGDADAGAGGARAGLGAGACR